MAAVEEAEGDATAVCGRCRRPFAIPAFIRAFALSWQRREMATAEREDRKPDTFSDADLGVCSECEPTVRLERAEREEMERRWTERYLADLRSNVRNPQNIQWLRDRGLGAEVDRIIAAIDNAAAERDRRAAEQQIKEARRTRKRRGKNAPDNVN